MFRHHHHHHHRDRAGVADWVSARRLNRRGERFFDSGDLRLVVLELLARQPSHGYELIKAIEEKVGGAYSPSPGVVYPTLTFLEELGLIAGEPMAAGRKLYQITEEGRATVERERPAIDRIFARMAQIQERFEGRSPRIGRAMGNLARAIAVRMAAGPVDQAQLDRIVAAIDAAAQAVETA